MFDTAFEERSNKLMEEFRLGLKVVVISDLALKEFAEAPQNLRSLIEEILEEHKEYVTLDNEAKTLAGHYFYRRRRSE